MAKSTENLTAREFVWVHRLRQRIAFEKIVLTAGNPKEQLRAKQFLEAMEEANPTLLEEIDHYIFELTEEDEHYTPELFDDSEYAKARGRKTALKLPKDILWEERVIQRAAREYRELFHPCEKFFKNAMKGLQYLHNLHPKVFARARDLAIEQRDQILSFEIYCQCDCTTPENRPPADLFKSTNQGRFKNVSERISFAKQTLQEDGDDNTGHWQFFLDRVGEVAPEMLQD
jgi:hypothetical protein